MAPAATPSSAPAPPRRRTPLRARCMQLLGWLRLRRPLKRLYCRLLGPNGGIIQVTANQQTVAFYVHRDASARDLANLQGERTMLDPMMDEVGPGDCAWDVGAEVGLYALFLARRVGAAGQIVAFEPSGEAFERLLDNLHLNRARQVLALRLALSDREGTLQLYREGTGYAPTLRDTAEILSGHTVVERVRVARGDTVRAERSLRPPNAVKVDVEGAEFGALQGLQAALRAPACRLLCCEIHPRILPEGVAPERIAAWIFDQGFTRQERRVRDANTIHLIARKPAFPAQP